MELSKATASAQFKVPDMECADCEARVDRAIRELDGICDVSTSLMAQKVTVRYAPGTVEEAGIVAAVRGAGYTVTDDGSAADATPFWNREKVLTAMSGFFLVVGATYAALWPETEHTYFWKGHFGYPDAFLVGAALFGGLNFFPQALASLLGALGVPRDSLEGPLCAFGRPCGVLGRLWGSLWVHFGPWRDSP